MAQRTQNTLVYSIRVSQCSVATRIRYGGIFNNISIANFPGSPPVENFENPLAIDEVIDMSWCTTFRTLY